MSGNVRSMDMVKKENIIKDEKLSTEMMDRDDNNDDDDNNGYAGDEDDTSTNSWSILSLSSSSSSWSFPSIVSENEQKQLCTVSNLLSDLDSIGSILSIEQVYDCDDDNNDIDNGNDEGTENNHRNQGDAYNRDISESKKPFLSFIKNPAMHPIENQTCEEEETRVKKNNGMPLSRKNVAGLQIFYNGSLEDVFSSSEGLTFQEPTNRNRNFCKMVHAFRNYLFMSIKSYFM
mmetsp:Transcript_57011/g.138869  ORF Transcript_57011/g.138869 Transcript_57011/m.138869 type:complete len:232 (-) Transcript_57011:35-730(-)